MKFATKAIHVGQAPDPSTGSTIIPIHLSTTYTQAGIGQHKGFEYSRAGNPTRAALETCLAALEGAQHALAFGSGCAATAAVTHLLKAGEHAVVSSEVYGGTYRLFELLMKDHGLAFTWVRGTDPTAFAAALRPNTRLVWIETPTNPTLSVIDIQAVVEVAHGQSGVLTVVDNTFATPYFQSPLALGADLVVHSSTKYLGGHSDVVGGCLMTNQQALRDRLHFVQKSSGGVPSPFDCWLTLRGIKTLALRMDRHHTNASQIATWLTAQSGVRTVYFPGLPTHPGHAVATRQMRGFAGMVSFELAGGRSTVERMVTRLHTFALAESLGGVESLCCYPATMTHAAIPAKDREAIGITDGLLRLSVGIEDVDDLLADLEQALG
ncbi:MAG: PLP-dependent transferase [Deltaproteobacteria bacterium]|nr:PLP-dependent transferase [Deltaproteobacteria bacterium]